MDHAATIAKTIPTVNTERLITSSFVAVCLRTNGRILHGREAGAKKNRGQKISTLAAWRTGRHALRSSFHNGNGSRFFSNQINHLMLGRLSSFVTSNRMLVFILCKYIE